MGRPLKPMLATTVALSILAGAGPARADFDEPSGDCPGALVRFEGTPDNPGDFIALIIPAGVTVVCTGIPDTPLTNAGAGEVEIFAFDFPDIGAALGGDFARIANSGTVEASGPEAIAAGIEGNGAEITNSGTLTATGTEAVAAGIEGDGGKITNTAMVNATGEEASGLFVEGDGGRIANSGDVTLGGDLAAGMLVDGASATLTNEGSIDTTGDTTVGMGVLGAGATLTNSGTIKTEGGEDGNAFGIGVFGTGATIENNASGTIETTGTGSHGIFLGLEDAGDLSGGFVPPGALAPAQGTVTNDGKIATSGAEADGIHGFADDSAIENRNEIATTGARAAGINQFGDRVEIKNLDTIKTEGENAPGIRARGQNLMIVNGAPDGETGEDARIATVGDGAHGILVAPQSGAETNPDLFAASKADVSNVTSIDTEGEKAHGILAAIEDSKIENRGDINVTGKDSIAVSVRGGGNEILNDGTLEAGTLEQAQMEAGQPPDPNGSPSGRVGVNFIGETRVENSADGSIAAFGENAAGVRGREGDKSAVANDGTIIAFGKGARGVDIEGDDVSVQNVGESGGPNVEALIAVEGEKAVGIRTHGEGAFVSNRVTRTEEGVETVGLSVSGNKSVGVDATATGSGAFLIENAGKMQVEGANAVGMALRNDSEGALAFSSPSVASDCAGSAKGAGLLNCGGLEVTGTTDPVGLLAQGLNDSTISNFGTIDVSGDRAVAIKLENIPNGAGADNNFILNLTDATAQGTEAKGVSIEGDGNILVQGNSEIILPVDAVTFTAISQSIDIMTSTITEGMETGEQTFPLGDIRASGAGAVGVSVEGDNNVVGVSMGLSDFDPTGETAGLPTAPKIASVIAEGAGSIGVELSGDNNTVANFGIISGEGKAIQGGAGKETVIGAGIFVGDIDLAGGDDEFNLGVGMDEKPFVGNDARSIAGTIDGGAGIDKFRLIDSRFFGGGGDLVSSGVEDFPEEFFRFGTVDGDRVRNFETFIVDITDQNVDLKNQFVVDTATIENGTLRLDSARLEAERIDIREGGFLTGNGTITALPNDIGLVNLSQIVVEAGAGVMPGDSPGTLEFIGDTIFAGLLEIEIAGREDGLFDRLLIDGDLTFDEALIQFVFLDGFLPEQGDIFDFLDVTGDLFGFDTLSFDFLGLPGGFGFGVSRMQLAGGFGLGLTTTMAEPTDVPVPATLALFGFGLAWLTGLRRWRKDFGASR